MAEPWATPSWALAKSHGCFHAAPMRINRLPRAPERALPRGSAPARGSRRGVTDIGDFTLPLQQPRRHSIRTAPSTLIGKRWAQPQSGKAKNPTCLEPLEG